MDLWGRWLFSIGNGAEIRPLKKGRKSPGLFFAYSGVQRRLRNEKLFFLFLNQNICCWYSKEPSHQNGSFEHPKNMFKLMGKKIMTIVYTKILLRWTYGLVMMLLTWIPRNRLILTLDLELYF